MRRLVKRLLKKYKYPPEEAEGAMNIVLKQCEQWAENEENPKETVTSAKSVTIIPLHHNVVPYPSMDEEDSNLLMAAEEQLPQKGS